MLAVALVGASLAVAAACQGTQSAKLDTENPLVPNPSVPVQPQETFDTPEAAVGALKDAVSNPDKDEIHHIFGPALKELVSGDTVEDKNNFHAFAEKAKEKTRIEMKSDSLANLYIGKDDYPFAIPLAKNAEGKWYFDTEAGKTEILARRIGRNELDTIAFMHAYVEAQREYASKDHDGSGVLKYAQRLVSSPGKKDGLYYPSSDANDQSPFGPLAADAALEGYGPVSGSRKNPKPYHGYLFHILKAQGASAPGGAYSYVINGNMIAGFGLAASPAEYGQSGIMTFIVNHQGKIYQKDLGPKTPPGSVTIYNPDSTWALVKE